MNSKEHCTEGPQTGRERLAAASSLTRVTDSLGSSRRVAVGVLLTAFVLIGALLLAGPASDLAASPCTPPVVQHKVHEEKVYATRAFVGVTVETARCEVEVKAEYATSRNGPWTLADKETIGSGYDFHTVFVGTNGSYSNIGAEGRILHHLAPVTEYFVRFTAKNQEGAESAETFAFTTTPVGEPEIAPASANAGQEDLTSFTDRPFRVSQTSAEFTADIESNGATSEYHFEYAASPSGPWKPFTAGGSGSISPAEDFVEPVAQLTGLTPETNYYVRVKVSNEKGAAEQARYLAGGDWEPGFFTTRTAKPMETKVVRNVTGSTAHVSVSLYTNGSETTWRLEIASSATGPWSPAPGIGGTVSQVEAEALGETGSVQVDGGLTGLSPATVYYVRLNAHNKAGEGEACAEPRGEYICQPDPPASLETSGPPVTDTFATHALHGEAIRLLAVVNPASTPTSAEQTITIGGAPTAGTFTLTFKGQTTPALPFDATSDKVQSALGGLASISDLGVEVSGPAGGPYWVYFRGPDGEASQPLIEANGSGLTPSGSVTVVTVQPGGVGYDTHYHFDYVAQEQFEKPGGEGGFAGAVSTPEVDLGSGNAPKFVGADLPGLKGGETYRYRVVATNNSPGSPVVDGEERTLVAPTPAPAQEVSACANESMRTGPSASLPDCRAYEQLTPFNKEGAEEIFGYGEGVTRGALAAGNGDHVVYEDAGTVNWDPGAGQGPYFFSRGEGGEGWQTTLGSPQPETSIDRPEPQLYDAKDLSRFAFESGYNTGPEGQSAQIQFKVGAPGGPYTTVASVPRSQVGVQGHWVAAAADFSKLVLQVEDHKLLGEPTGTLSGYDLYEYSAGELRQVNVDSEGQPLGSCGARIASGHEGTAQGHREAPEMSSPHAVSADGSRVFFEAVPGGNCSASRHLYVREQGERTLDVGAYSFLAASSDGSEVLLEKQVGESTEVFLYDVQTHTASLLFSRPSEQGQIAVSEELSAIYFESTKQLSGTGAPAISPTVGFNAKNLYRYDIPSRALSFIAQVSNPVHKQLSRDGRYYYFEARAVGGLPGGSLISELQIYRYDSAGSVVQCMSCASPYDPEPKLAAYLEASTAPGRIVSSDVAPASTLVSDNGDYAFFYTASELLSSDVDGEMVPMVGGGGEFESFTYSPSTDVYEWRKDGVNGCAHLQGCLALITSGHGGTLNMLIGSAEEGRDVFFTSTSQLVPQDQDSTLNIFDARIGGGVAPAPSRPVECEADACSTPASAPIDATPSSLTFAGAGNAIPVAVSKPAVKKSKKPKLKKKPRRGKRGKGKRARRATGGSGRVGRSAGRSGR